jgi:hypothetical protein
MLAAEQTKREADAAHVEVDKTTDPGDLDMRSLAERIGLQAGLDIDAELARRKEQDIADPNSPQSIASARRAAAVAERCGLDPDTRRLYALFLRTCDLARPRLTSVTVADRFPSQRYNVTVETTGPGGPPPGFAHFYPSRVNTHLVRLANESTVRGMGHHSLLCCEPGEIPHHSCSSSS